MHILLVNQFFYPDHAATSQIMTDLAVDLAAKGEEVSVVAGRGTYLGGERLAPFEEHRGVRIHRPWGTSLGKRSIAHRLADYLSFFAASAAKVAALERPDLVITLSTPPLISALGGLAQAARRARFLYWVQDLYPDVAVAFGVLRPRSPATRTFEAISRAALRQADHVVAIGEVMAERLKEKGLPDDRLSVIHNWSDAALAGVGKRENWFLDKHRLFGKFVVQYSGNMGRGHEFGTLLNAAERLGHRQDMAFVFIGDGAKRLEIEGAVRERKLGNVQLLPYQRREDLPYSMGAADVCAISLSDGLEGLIVPSKLYGIMAAGKPAISFGPRRSEIGRVLAEERCGETFAHGDVEGAVRFLERLADRPGEAEAMGSRGREAFLAKYERSRATARFHALCRRVVEGRRC